MERIDYIDEWNIAENYFSEESLGKLEVNMAMGNGYLGVRNCHEESYVTEKRNMFVAGIFNKFSKKEVTELANMPDISKISVWLNGKRLTLNRGRVTQYRRVFNYRNGESVRSFIWESETGFSVRFIFKKFVSMYNKHLIVTEMTAENLGKQATMAVQSGIDGTFTNTGSQHFEEGEKRYLDNQFLYLQTQTTEKKTKVALATCHKLNKAHQTEPSMKRRQLYENKEFDLLENETVTFTKYSLLKTGQDLEYTGKDYLRQGLIDELNSITRERYRDLLSASATVWEKIWEESKTEIRGDTQDALLLNAARYHLHIMTPVHDNRLNISGKGLSGEGYKGHTFWDTEIFILPYFVYTFPHWAKSLVTYRLKGLGAAKENADLKGYSGALYPWESAWLSDGEVTPKFGGIDVVSGKRREVLTGKIEHHITGDVIYGLMQYLKATNDIEMKKNAFSLLMETAIFWTSRVNYNKQLDRYEILDVIGPDEYKEHVNNNAYTNYLAKYNLDVALRAYAESKNIELKNKYKNQFNIIKEIANKLYLPVPNKEGILPQDDNYLKKQMIDLTKYFEAEEVKTIFKDYNLQQMNEIQVSKQADVILTMLLFPNSFTLKEKEATWEYYFPKTLHDSSLSLTSYCNFALLLGKDDIAYYLFKKSFETDLGPKNMHSSDDGIHAASMGGVWQNVVYGFGGFSIKNDVISIKPRIPENWDELLYTVVYKQTRLTVKVSKKEISIQVLEGELETILVNDQEYSVMGRKLTIQLLEEK